MRTSVKVRQTKDSSEDGGLSIAAQRILNCLEKMSTPISDAKRIPTPSPGLRGSYLEGSAYTAAFHKHRPLLKTGSTPPVERLLTPTKVNINICILLFTVLVGFICLIINSLFFL